LPEFRQMWPRYDAELAKQDLTEIPVQVNGRLRAHLRVAPGTAKQELERLALEQEKVRPFLEGKDIIKVIVLPDRLVNVVVK
jgi:leucyl-tRNA synthetase